MVALPILVLTSVLCSNAALNLGEVEWFSGPYFSARAKAKAEDKWIMLAFWAEGYAWCEKLAKDTFSDESTLQALDNLLCISVDLSRDADGRYKALGVAKYTQAFPVQTFPTIIFVGPNGEREDIISGYIPPSAFLAELNRITSRIGTLSALEAAVLDAPRDIEARYALSGKLFDLGFLERSRQERAVIDEQDPEKRSLPLRREALSILQEELFEEYAETKRMNFRALERFLEDEEHPKVLNEGWHYLSNLYRQFKEPKKARGATMKAWAHIPEHEKLDAGFRIAQTFWQERPQLSRDEKRFALEVARQTAEKAEALSRKIAGDDHEPLSGPKYDAFLAARLDTLACCYALNGKRAEALALVTRCRELDPENATYAQRADELRHL